MALRINTNITALTAHKNLVLNDERQSASIERLSSGLRINRASDDAAGLTISEKLRTQVRGINRAIMNVQDGISLIQTAEGALNEVHSMLQRMRELAVQSSNDTLTSTDRLEIQKEVTQLKEDINRISYGTEFNTKKLLDGTGTAVISTSDPTNLDGVVVGDVQTFSDFSVVVWPIPGREGTPQIQRSNIMMRTDGVIASGSTTLQSISNFTDSNGNFILDIPQTLYTQGDNKQGALVVSKDLTLDQLAERMQLAMTTDQLGSGLKFEGSVAKFSTLGETNGQMEVTSGKTGNIGRISLTGEEALVKVLGFQQVIAPVDPVYSIVSVNMGEPVATRQSITTQIAGSRASGLIQGIDLMFQPPTKAFVDTISATMGISIAAQFSFNLDDSLSASAPVLITIHSGVFTMDKLVTSINDQLTAVAPFPSVRARLNDSYALEFYTLNTGSAAYVDISGLTASDNSLRVANGRQTGSGGDAGLVNGGAVPTSLDFSVNNCTFTIDDLHTIAHETTITLAKNYLGGMTSVVDDINSQITALGLKINAVNNNGILQLKSMETGSESNFSIVDIGVGASANLLSTQLNIGNGASTSGLYGSAADRNFAFDKVATKMGYSVLGVAGTDDLSFAVMDLDGKTFPITVAAASAGASFHPIQSFVSMINDGANQNQVQVNAEILTGTQTLRIYSTVPGKTGEVTLTQLTELPASTNTLNTVFSTVGSDGISGKTYDNGYGNFSYTMHVKDAYIQFQIGPNEGHFAKSNIIRTDVKALGIEDLNLTTVADSQMAIGLVDKAIQRISSERAKLGAIENRMTYTSTSLRVGLENMTASESRIRDIDMASEVTNMTKYQILTQASQAMLAQANTASQRILELLR